MRLEPYRGMRRNKWGQHANMTSELNKPSQFFANIGMAKILKAEGIEDKHRSQQWWITGIQKTEKQKVAEQRGNRGEHHRRRREERGKPKAIQRQPRQPMVNKEPPNGRAAKAAARRRSKRRRKASRKRKKNTGNRNEAVEPSQRRETRRVREERDRERQKNSRR